MLGYGYQAPSKDATRLFTIFILFFGILAVFTAIVDFLNYLVKLLRSRIRKKMQHDRYMVTFAISCLAIFATVIVGATFMYFVEGTSFITGIYFSVVTSTVSKYFFFLVMQA